MMMTTTTTIGSLIEWRPQNRSANHMIWAMFEWWFLRHCGDDQWIYESVWSWYWLLLVLSSLLSDARKTTEYLAPMCERVGTAVWLPNGHWDVLGIPHWWTANHTQNWFDYFIDLWSCLLWHLSPVAWDDGQTDPDARQSRRVAMRSQFPHCWCNGAIGCPRFVKRSADGVHSGCFRCENCSTNSDESGHGSRDKRN